ncbi:hypothetical protein GUJ93_ZPchr0002g25309 [Zizania palustris]|uniref:Uncharacterized protein n=1 Tax=Zizania palustris TaxID=103762 RepID=A0A8J5SH63_ZIZPA|nr:hypothetical protein GUJ93_ZPchr0002g25309 [Zizania palustris]KAG8058117.1 hypothetical protein GUJ93_ZPchr0002g25309 [Zizania palustris]
MEAERPRRLRLSKPAPSSSSAEAAPDLPPPPPRRPTIQPTPHRSPAKLLSRFPINQASLATQMKRAAPEVTPAEQLIMQEKEMVENLSDRKTLMPHARARASQGGTRTPTISRRAGSRRSASAACPAPRPTYCFVTQFYSYLLIHVWSWACIRRREELKHSTVTAHRMGPAPASACISCSTQRSC